MRFSKRTRGFSFFEMGVVLMLTAILMSLALPSWGPLLRRSESQMLLQRLQEALQFARQEALLRQEGISLCGSSKQKICTGDWQEGILVFISTEGEEQGLRIFHWGKLQGVLHWRAFAPRPQYCQFLPSGETYSENGTFWYCLSAASYPSWAVVLAQSGHWQVRYPSAQEGLRDARGRLLAC